MFIYGLGYKTMMSFTYPNLLNSNLINCNSNQYQEPLIFYRPFINIDINFYEIRQNIKFPIPFPIWFILFLRLFFLVLGRWCWWILFLIFISLFIEKNLFGIFTTFCHTFNDDSTIWFLSKMCFFVHFWPQC